MQKPIRSEHTANMQLSNAAQVAKIGRSFAAPGGAIRRAAMQQTQKTFLQRLIAFGTKR